MPSATKPNAREDIHRRCTLIFIKAAAVRLIMTDSVQKSLIGAPRPPTSPPNNPMMGRLSQVKPGPQVSYPTHETTASRASVTARKAPLSPPAAAHPTRKAQIPSATAPDL